MLTAIVRDGDDDLIDLLHARVLGVGCQVLGMLTAIVRDGDGDLIDLLHAR